MGTTSRASRSTLACCWEIIRSKSLPASSSISHPVCSVIGACLLVLLSYRIGVLLALGRRERVWEASVYRGPGWLAARETRPEVSGRVARRTFHPQLELKAPGAEAGPGGKADDTMAFGFAENPSLSITPHLDSVDYPATREQIVTAAADNGAYMDIINVLKSLPQEEYQSREDVMRDLAEAARRFATGGLRDDDGVDRDRRNIGRDLVENAPDGNSRHP